MDTGGGSSAAVEAPLVAVRNRRRKERKEEATDLNAGLGEVDAHGDLFSRVNVRVVRLLEGAFQLLLFCSRNERSKDSSQSAMNSSNN
jgi:hypothetical protein